MNGGLRRVLVTGASGFIGRHALHPLLNRGYEVHGADLQEAEDVPRGVQVHRADLLDGAQARRLMDEVRPTHLLHFAWYVKHGEFWTSPENLHWVQASLDLYQAFVASGGIRMVTSGTCAEYDWSHVDLVEGETPLRPATLYGACKHALNTIAGPYAAGAGIGAAWGRVFLLYGPHEHPGRLVSGAIRALLNREAFPCSSGRQVRDAMHVHDVADAFAALLDSEVEGEVNIASGEARAIADIVAEIGRQLGGEELIHWGAREAAPHDPPVLRAAVDRLRDEVGWCPSYSLVEGLADTITWWQDHRNRGL